MPSASLPRLGFIGAGRLGTGLAWGLARTGYPVVAVASRDRASADRLAAGAPGCRAYSVPQEVANRVDLVFLTVPDDAIAGVCAGVAWRAGQAVVHCSGATEIAVLSPASSAGARAGGFHPLQMFTDPETALRGLPGCTIAIEAEPPLLGVLEKMAKALGCHALRVPPGKRALYHAGAVYTAAFLNALVQEALRLWAPLGFDEAQGIRALLPLLRGTIDSIERCGPAQGMAGPMARGDAGTVKMHLKAISALGSDMLDLYCRLALRAVDLGIARGSLAPDKAAELQTLLHTALRSREQEAASSPGIIGKT